jgi:hypothetical protein
LYKATDKMKHVGDDNPGAELVGKREIGILLYQRLFELDADTFDAFATTLDNPSPAGPALKALMKRRQPWEK